MLDGLLPESGCRELLAQYRCAAVQKDLPRSDHTAGRVVQWQRIVHNVVVLHRAHEEGGTHEKHVTINGGLQCQVRPISTLVLPLK